MPVQIELGEGADIDFVFILVQNGLGQFVVESVDAFEQEYLVLPQAQDLAGLPLPLFKIELGICTS